MDKNTKGQLVEKLRHYINLLSGINDELYKRIKLSSSPFINDILWSNIIEDINKIEEILNKQNSIWSKLTIVVCHNDTQSLNFLYNQQKISLIDFEHCARNFWLFDVYDYFIEYAGVDIEEPDYDQTYPTREKQKKWLETYLSNAQFLNDKYEKSITIDELCDLGDYLRAPIHLYWSLWSFLEGLLNSEALKKFDYIKYGKCRLKQYEKYKNEFFLSIEKISTQ
jgi:thiamine kinase-like enzyme